MAEVQRRTVLRVDTKNHKFYGVLENFLGDKGEYVRSYSHTRLRKNVKGKVYRIGDVTASLERPRTQDLVFCELRSYDVEHLEGLVGEILALDPRFIRGEGIGQ